MTRRPHCLSAHRVFAIVLLASLPSSSVLADDEDESNAADADSDASDNEEGAKALFKAGRKSLRAGEFAKACEQFEASIEAKPSVGAYLNLGECNERQRKLASATRAWQAASRLARKTGDKKKRARFAKARAKELRSRRSFLIVTVGDVSDGDLEITVGGEPLHEDDIDEAMPIDIGLHRVTATIDGELRFQADARLTDEGETVTIEVIEMDEPEVVIPAVVLGKRSSPVPALSVLAGSVVLAGAGTYFGLSASSRWNDASACRESLCTQDDADLEDSARFRGNVSTGMFIAAGATAAVGLWMFVKSRERKREPDDASPVIAVTPSSVSLITRF